MTPNETKLLAAQAHLDVFRTDLDALAAWVLDCRETGVDFTTFREECDRLYGAAVRALNPLARVSSAALGQGVVTLDAACGLHGAHIPPAVSEHVRRLPGGREYLRALRGEE